MAASSSPRRTSDHALAQLHYIRHTMDGAARFTALPGKGFVLIGITALAAASIAAHEPWSAGWFPVWLAEAVVATTVGVLALRAKMRRNGLDLRSGPARKFLLAFLPSGVCTAALTYALWQHDVGFFIPPVWLLGYGTGIIASGAHSVLAVPAMGVAFVLAGLAALVSGQELHNLLLGLSFGGFHILFGIYIARTHGG